MQPANGNAAGLAPEELERLAAWLRQFEQGWDDGALARAARTVPFTGSLRRAALAGMVKVDLQRRWQQGRAKPLEAYLTEHPELGTPETVALDLIQAEMQVRRQAGEAVSWADLAGRFPRQTEQLRRGLEQLWQKSPGAGRSTLASGTGDQSVQLGTLLPGGESAPGSLPPERPVQVVSVRPQSHPSLQVPPDGSDEPTLRPDGTPADHTHTPHTSLEPAPQPGDLRRSPMASSGRYAILRQLGQGAMGTVYLAQDRQLQREVALKIPRFNPGEDSGLRERFLREARAAASLHHPNICPVYDVGEDAAGVPYLTMAYVEGQQLGEVLRACRPMPQRRAAEIVLALARGLEEAHRRGVVHRDLKPSNVMINQRGEPVVMDFGLARRLNQDARLTHQGSVLGTPAYMSPEQVQGNVDAIGPLSDVYSLGVILYELLVGRAPFLGSSGQVMASILTETPQSPCSLRPDLDPQLEQICQHAMARSPAERYQSMGEFAAALSVYLQLASDASAAVFPPLVPSGPLPPDTHSGLPAQPGSGRGRAVLVALLALLLTGGVAYLVWQMWPVTPEGESRVSVAIHSTPAGATVYLDGKKQGQPTNASFSLTPGRHQVRLELAGHEPLRREVTIRAGEANKALTFELTRSGPPPPLLGAVNVRIGSKPSGATVSVNGKPMGQTELTVPLKPGEYEVALQLPGYEELLKKIEVQPGTKGLSFVWALSTAGRDVVLKRTPADARVEIDGVVRVPGKDGRFRLPVGKHELRLEREGHEPLTEQIDVRPGAGPQMFTYVLKKRPPVQYALLVGVHRPGGGLPDFLHAEQDVAELGRLLIAGGYAADKVTVLTQTEGAGDPQRLPTAVRIRQKLRGLVRGCAPGDSVVVALVGHAARPKDSDDLFCPAGSDLKVPETLLPLREVYAELGKCKAQVRLLLLDCWRRGATEPPPGSLVGQPRRKLVSPGVPVLLACSAGELSYEHPSARHGAFLAAVLRTLLDERDQTLGGLVATVRTDVAALLSRAPKAKQTPELVGAPDNTPRPPLQLGGVLAQYRRGVTLLDQVKEAKGAEKAKAAADAIEALEAAVRLDSQFADAYLRRAEANFYAGKLEPALADARKAHWLAPGCATALDHIAEFLSLQKDYQDALATYAKAIALEPNYALVYNDRGEAQYKTKALDEAIKDFSRAIDLNPRLKVAYMNRAVAYFRLPVPELSATIKDTTRVIELDENDTVPWYWRARAHLEKKEYKEAVRDFNVVVTRERENDSAFDGLADAYRGLRDFPQEKKARARAREIRKKAGR
jgi:serine/threonine protein kinase/tetratricopeptide (TPR) repeat protein